MNKSVIPGIVLGVCAALSLGLYYVPFTTLGILTGLLWAGANLYFIQQMLHHLLISKNYCWLAVMGLVKFPCLYVVAYGLLLIEPISPLNFLIGIILMLALSPAILPKLQRVGQ